MPARIARPIERRKLLSSLGSSAAVAAASAAALTSPGGAAAYDPGPDETRARYQPDSPSVRAFYRTNGYETLNK